MTDPTSQYNIYESKKNEYVKDLKDIIINSKEILEGNVFYQHKTLTEIPELKAKQINLFWCGKQVKTRLCEIGFNAGHSAMVMLFAIEQMPVDFTIFDIDQHKYTEPCYNYIKSKFPNVSFEFVKGNSIKTMPEWIKIHSSLVGTYDIVHLDGGHSEECISNDIKHSDMLVKKGGLIIIDDTNAKHINEHVNRMLSSGKYKENTDILKTSKYLHRIIQKL